MNSTRICFSKLINEILKTDTTIYMLPINTTDNITYIIDSSLEICKELISG